METTNKRLALYIGLILAGLVFALLILDILTLAQAQLALVTIGTACIPFGLADAVYDYLGLMVKIGEQAAKATPSPDDDLKVAEFKQLLETLRQQFSAPTATQQTVNVFTEDVETPEAVG